MGRHRQSRQIPNWLYWILAAVCFLLAAYAAAWALSISIEVWHW